MNTEELARKAQQLLDDPLVQQVFAKLEARYINDFRGSAANEAAKRETAYARLTALQDLKRGIEDVVYDHKVRAHNSSLKTEKNVV